MIICQILIQQTIIVIFYSILLIYSKILNHLDLWLSYYFLIAGKKPRKAAPDGFTPPPSCFTWLENSYIYIYTIRKILLQLVKVICKQDINLIMIVGLNIVAYASPLGSKKAHGLHFTVSMRLYVVILILNC